MRRTRKELKKLTYPYFRRIMKGENVTTVSIAKETKVATYLVSELFTVFLKERTRNRNLKEYF